MYQSKEEDPYQISIISKLELQKLVKTLVDNDFQVDVYEEMPKQLETWYASPDLIIIDENGVESWQEEFEKLKSTLQFKHVTVILIADKECSYDYARKVIEKGIFFCAPKTTDEIFLLLTLSACKNSRYKKELLDDNQALNRQLSSNYLVNDAKNKFLSDLKEKIDQLSNKPVDSILKQLQKISDELEKHNKNEYQYQLFKVHFEEVHPLFFLKLNALNKELTENNLKLLAFIKMGFNNTEIAFLMNVSLSSIKKHIQRLKPKLRIESEDSLREFVFSIESKDIEDFLN